MEKRKVWWRSRGVELAPLFGLSLESLSLSPSSSLPPTSRRRHSLNEEKEHLRRGVPAPLLLPPTVVAPPTLADASELVLAVVTASSVALATLLTIAVLSNCCCWLLLLIKMPEVAPPIDLSLLRLTLALAVPPCEEEAAEEAESTLCVACNGGPPPVGTGRENLAALKHPSLGARGRCRLIKAARGGERGLNNFLHAAAPAAMARVGEVAGELSGVDFSSTSSLLEVTWMSLSWWSSCGSSQDPIVDNLLCSGLLTDAAPPTDPLSRSKLTLVVTFMLLVLFGDWFSLFSRELSLLFGVGGGDIGWTRAPKWAPGVTAPSGAVATVPRVDVPAATEVFLMLRLLRWAAKKILR